jgi:23S rRNA (adenine2503-C2)-methyltransferase
MTPDALRAWCAARRMPAFRADQILEWVYGKGVADPASMSNLNKLDREMLAREMAFESGETLRHLAATDGTQKLLVQWNDCAPGTVTNVDSSAAPSAADAAARPSADASTSNASTGLTLPQLDAASAFANIGDPSRQTECVMIPSIPEREGDEPDRFTACISSQVGCPVGCRFCASGLTGLDHNLSTGRIVEQVWRLARLRGVRRITNVVFMGMGEPLANLPNVVPAVRTLAAPWGMGISARKITISTVGLPKAIEKLAEQLDLPVTLALSLHAPTDDLRRELIPWAEYTTIADLLGACRRWFERTGREITLEYTLLRGVNDRPEHAEELGRLARTLRANVNLIRYNEVKGLPFERPRTDDVLAFQETLRGRGVNAHIRASRGRDIAAACGQLRHEHAKGSSAGATA